MRSGPIINISGSLASALALALAVQSAAAQSRNNPYSPSPDKKGVAAVQPKLPVNQEGQVTFRMASDRPNQVLQDEPVRIAQADVPKPKPSAAKPAAPTDLYKIGIGDVLFVQLKNAANGSGYFTVRTDGTIDYPLAGENVAVVGQTTETVEAVLASGIRLFASPQVEVKVREYASHKISVSGSVENAGEKSLQREAMPLFAVRAEAVVNPKASKVRIKRAGSANEELLDLHDGKSDETLVFPGDQLHFFGDVAGTAGAYFISGEIVAGGQKDLAAGMTLYQAVIASGGTKGDPKKAIIRRKNDKGMLENVEHNLRSIKSGKAMDPILAAGDIIEIKN